MKTIIANKSNVVIDESGKRLYGMDAELFEKMEGKKDHNLELKIALWLENLLQEELIDRYDLWLSLKNGSHLHFFGPINFRLKIYSISSDL